MHDNVIQIGEPRNYLTVKQAVSERAKAIGATLAAHTHALNIGIRELRNGRSTGAAIALANSSMGGPRNTRLQHSPGGAA